MSARSWRIPGIPQFARLSRSAFAFLLAIPLALLALAPLAGTAAAHAARQAAPAINKAPGPAVDLTLHYRATLSGINQPLSLATDAQGNLYVSDYSLELVRMYNSSDTFVRSYGTGTTGTGNGSFNIPAGIAVSADGTAVYVADFGNGVVQTFTQSTGVFIKQFGSGDLNHPDGLALGSNGTLYVVDNTGNRIAEFTTTGSFLGSFGTYGSGNGQFNTPVGIAFNPTNSQIYVTDAGNKRVEAFTLAGGYVTQWGSASFSQPEGIAVDRSGMVYVTDNQTQTVYKFDPGGSLVGDYAAPLTTPFVSGTFSGPTGVAVRSVPNTPLAVYVADATAGVQRFDQVLDPQTHTYQAEWSAAGGDFFNLPIDAAMDPSGNIYVVDRSNDKVYKFDQFGNYLLAFGGLGAGNGQFAAPSGIAVSPDGTKVYVADTDNSRIEVFDSSGNYLSQFGTAGSGNGQFNGPFALATDGTDLYVADTGNNRIEIFTTSGTYQSQFGSFGSGNDQFASPEGIAVDINRQELFISDLSNNRIQVTTTNGTFLTSINSAASINFNMPEHVSTDQRGDVYVADNGNSRIVEFDVNITRTTAFGTNGTGNGQFNAPYAAVVSPSNGQIYIADSSNSRVQRWGSPWPKNDTIGIYRPSTKTFYLRTSNSTGPANIVVHMPYAQSGDLPVVGDWNGDGVDTVGLYRSSTGNFLLQDANVQESKPDYVFTLGVPGDTPIAGDWNGQGADGAGIFRPSNGILYLKNTLSTGYADDNLVLGKPGDVGIAGDWNGDGQDSPGAYRPSNETFYVTNKVTDGIVYADATAVFGISGDAPFTGDWVAQGSSGIGVFRPSNGITYEKNSIVTGPADNHFIYGVANDIPVAGQWVEPSVPFTAPAPHVSLGTRVSGTAHPASRSGSTPAPTRTAVGGHTSAAMPRRATPR